LDDFLGVQFLINQLSEMTDLSCCFHFPSLLLSSALYPQEIFCFDDMAPAKPIGLGDYWTILVVYNQEYQNSKGADHWEIIAVIMQEMVAQSKGTIQKDILKGNVCPLLETKHGLCAVCFSYIVCPFKVLEFPGLWKLPKTS
jgi:hypothetical protein